MFNIFKNDDGGTHWVEAVPALDVARAHVLAFQEFWPAEYLVVNRDTGESISMKTDIDPPNRCASHFAPAGGERAHTLFARLPHDALHV
jgi:hypothetical protein